MTTPQRYRLEIRRTGERFETHGFFASLALAGQAAQGDVEGTGQQHLGAWRGPDASGR